MAENGLFVKWLNPQAYVIDVVPLLTGGLSTLAPDLPTVQEAGIANFSYVTWYGVSFMVWWTCVLILHMVILQPIAQWVELFVFIHPLNFFCTV